MTEECGRCGGIINTPDGCGWCEAQDIRAENERRVETLDDREPIAPGDERYFGDEAF